jgi:hypothetical protein
MPRSLVEGGASVGVAIYPVFKPTVDEASFDYDGGKLLARYFDKLDAVAEAVGAPAFTSFGDNRPIPEDFDGDPDDLGEAMGPWDEWFPIDDGLRTVEGLISAIESGIRQAKSLKQKDDIVDVLRELASCLRKAKKRGARFHLEMS